MESQKPAAKRGRPSTKTAADVAAPAPKKSKASAPKAAKPTIKRSMPDLEKKPKLYELVGGRGGIFYKVRTNNVTVFDEEAGFVRQIRYCPGEKSIFVDEQSEVARVEHVIFRNKMIVVPYDKPNLRAYLDIHPDNQQNGGGAFRLVNGEQNIEKEIESDFLVNDAISLIKARPVSELLPVAIAFNININQDDLKVKHQLVRMAKKKPQEFIDMFDNPLVQARTTVTQGMDFNIVTEKKGAIIWPDTGKMILSVPVGQDPVETLTRFCMTDKGASVLAEIDRQLSDIA